FHGAFHEERAARSAAMGDDGVDRLEPLARLDGVLVQECWMIGAHGAFYLLGSHGSFTLVACSAEGHRGADPSAPPGRSGSVLDYKRAHSPGRAVRRACPLARPGVPKSPGP